jgi:PBP1b-binding outer membrane lipoprotein LpoB
MKKFMTILGTILFASILLTGCGSGVDEKNKEDSKSEEVTATAENTKNN